MNTWTKETDQLFLEMWGKSNPDEIAAAVNKWLSDYSLSKGNGFSTITTARGVMFHALKFGLISPEEVAAFDKRQKSDRSRRGHVSSMKAQSVLQRDNNQCLACGSKDNLQVAHIIPVSRGGNSDADNLQTLCVSCRKDTHLSGVNFRKPFAKHWCEHCQREHYQNIE